MQPASGPSGERARTRARTAYILVWFPKPSETFVFGEVVSLQRMGLPLRVFTLYGELRDHLSPEMRSCEVPVERLGLPYVKRVLSEMGHWRRRNPDLFAQLMREVPWRRWRGIEKGGESLWAFLCAFHMARRFQEEGIEHIHAPWACGPATAAWVASRLTGIPFSFTGRAHDIYPPDGAIREKIRDAVLVRTETRAGARQLNAYADGDERKIRVTHNGVPLGEVPLAVVPMHPPYRFLAVGRLVPTKGFDVLLSACQILALRQVDFRLTIAGNGSRLLALKALAFRLGLSERVSFPGFVTHDRVSGLFQNADVFVMPCLVDRSGNRDGLPTVILEALLHCVPVVATDVSGVGEIIEDGVTGRLVRERDPSALADAIQETVKDRERALAMAARGRQRVQEEFDASANHRRTMELYAEALAR
jgi:colanic acid/amylovoran biosynthesis glycosyltransferase